MKIDITKAFKTSGEPLANLLQQPGVGYYIPLYQRDYSWDAENVEQLMEDIQRGVDSVLQDEASAIHFMGTVLLVTERNTQNINPRDPRALPTRIDTVIDGQQRLSTLALLASLLYQRLDNLKARIPADHELQDAIDWYLAQLLEMFSVDLRRGVPNRKPVIIRGSIDGWTLAGADDDHYKSDVARYLAGVIRTIHDRKSTITKYPALPTPRDSLVGKNLKLMDAALKQVEGAHTANDEAFPTAWEIVKHFAQDDLWNYERTTLADGVTALESKPESQFTKQDKAVCSLTQLFAYSHFLLQRCCLTVIEPVEERWAFDMFQSLNATGTPLTAVETFKPLVVNTIPDYKGSTAEQHMERVVELLGREASVASKTRITNQYLTTLALEYGGEKLASRFSAQRKWLQRIYDDSADAAAKEEFVWLMGNLATYWTEVVGFDPSASLSIPYTDGSDTTERDLAALCALYLQDAGHTIAHSILARFYDQANRGGADAGREFVAACKAVAAFFTLWRSASNNTGLDEVYRSLLREKMSWKNGNSELTVTALRQYFLKQLDARNLGSRTEWKPRATSQLRYDQAQVVCRFALFVAAHDSIVDEHNPGLMKVGSSGVYEYLHPSKWRSGALKTVEHIAPQRPPDGSKWSPDLYEEGYYERIGNLTLLPLAINASAGNKSWTDKYIYYRHLSETDPDKLNQLRAEADASGVVLANDTVELLKTAAYNHHILPLVQLGISAVWDAEVVRRRSERICEILWDRVRPWLDS